MSALNSCSIARSESSTDTPCSATGAGTWKMLARERAEAGLVRRDLAGQRHAHEGAAVEGAGERDHAGAAGGSAGDLDRVLDRLGAGREEARSSSRCVPGVSWFSRSASATALS